MSSPVDAMLPSCAPWTKETATSMETMKTAVNEGDIAVESAEC